MKNADEKENLSISVLIATLNEEAHLEEVLNAILTQDYDLNYLEIFVIDGGSTDRTLEIANRFLEKFPRFNVLKNDRMLSASGWNLGISRASSPVVSILSGHVLLPKLYFRTIAEALTPMIAGIGTPTKPIGECSQSEVIAGAFSSRLGNGGASFMNRRNSGPVESIAFGCYWKSKIIEVGGFDERIVRGQDWDLNMRIRCVGGILWLLNELETTFYTRTSYKALWQRQFLAGRWKRYIHQKSSKPFLTRHWIPSAFVGSFIGFLTASFALPSMLLVCAFMLVSHFAISVFQMRALQYPWHKAISFWKAILIIHFGYGAGMISSFITPVNQTTVQPERGSR